MYIYSYLQMIPRDRFLDGWLVGSTERCGIPPFATRLWLLFVLLCDRFVDALRTVLSRIASCLPQSTHAFVMRMMNVVDAIPYSPFNSS